MSITILTVDLSTVPDDHWPRLQSVLDDAERSKAEDFRFERHRRQHVAAHALKRLMLSPLVGLPPQEISFILDTNGKPEFDPVSGPFFNLTHSDGLVACAICTTCPVGIDVEPLNRPAPLAIADSFFTPAERTWLLGLPSAERDAGFFSLWTLKEAYIKATGRGLTQETRAFSVSVTPPSIRFHDPALGDDGLWNLRLIRLPSHHILSAAWPGSADAFDIAPANWDDLFAGTVGPR